MEEYSNTVIFYHTFSHKWFKIDLDDAKDSKIYYHFPGFAFMQNYPQGEYRYYVLPFTSGELTVENNKIYVDGEPTSPEASGLLQYGDYTNPSVDEEYNKMTTFVEYEG